MRKGFLVTWVLVSLLGRGRIGLIHEKKGLFVYFCYTKCHHCDVLWNNWIKSRTLEIYDLQMINLSLNFISQKLRLFDLLTWGIVIVISSPTRNPEVVYWFMRLFVFKKSLKFVISKFVLSFGARRCHLRHAVHLTYSILRDIEWFHRFGVLAYDREKHKTVE